MNSNAYLLKKYVTVQWKTNNFHLTIYPRYDSILNIDLTTHYDRFSEMEVFGSIIFINLYFNITMLINLKYSENVYDKYTIIQIMKAMKEVDEIILSRGTHAKKTIVEAWLETLIPHKKKVKHLINPVINEIMHPLNSKARKKSIYK